LSQVGPRAVAVAIGQSKMFSVDPCLKAGGGLPAAAAPAASSAAASNSVHNAEDSDGDAGIESVGLSDLPHEPWMQRSPEEIELWELARPSQLRQEAAQVWALRFPSAAVNRLMRLHSDMQVKSSEVLDVVNCSTILVLRHLVQAVARQKVGQTVRFDDVWDAVARIRELAFVQPLSSTLDASSRVLREASAPQTLGLASHHGVTAHEAGAQQENSRAEKLLAPGQKTLSSSAFSRSTSFHGRRPEAAAAGSLQEQAPPQAAQSGAAAGRKRSAAAGLGEQANADAGKKRLRAKASSGGSAASSTSARSGVSVLSLLKRPEAPAGG